MDLADLLWLGGTAVGSVTVGLSVLAISYGALDRRLDAQEKDVADLKAALEHKVDKDGLHKLREDMKEWRSELRAELRDLRNETATERDNLHQRLSGISRDLERLVGRIAGQQSVTLFDEHPQHHRG